MGTHSALESIPYCKEHREHQEVLLLFLAHLISKHKKTGSDLTTAVQQALREVTGTFGIAVMDKDTPEVIVVAKRGSPLVIGIGTDEMLAASDVSAFVRLTKQVVYLNDNDVATLTKGNYSITGVSDEKSHKREVQTVD